MTKKEKFIEVVNTLFNELDMIEYCNGDKEYAQDVFTYFEALKADGSSGKPKFTENGKAILLYMRENKDVCKNLFQAKTVGEGMGITSKTASGAMRKLVNDGYVEKIGQNPVSYSVTELGMTVDVDAE